MKKEIRIISSPFGNWRFVELKNGFPVKFGPNHVKGIQKLPEDVVKNAESIESLEAVLAQTLIKSAAAAEVLNTLNGFLTEGKEYEYTNREGITTKHTLESSLPKSGAKNFDVILESMLNKVKDEQTLGQMMQPEEFANFLKEVLGKVMDYTSTLFETTKTDDEREKASDITTYLVETTVVCIDRVEKETFKAKNEELEAIYKAAQKEFDEKDAKYKELQSKIEILKKDNADLDKKIADAEEALRAIKEAFEAATAKKATEAAVSQNEASTIIAQTRSKITQKEGEIKTATDELDIATTNNNTKKNHLAEVTSQTEGFGKE